MKSLNLHNLKMVKIKSQQQMQWLLYQLKDLLHRVSHLLMIEQPAAVAVEEFQFEELVKLIQLLLQLQKDQLQPKWQQVDKQQVASQTETCLKTKQFNKKMNKLTMVH